MSSLAPASLAPARNIRPGRQLLGRLRVQLLIALFLVVLLPIALGHQFNLARFQQSASGINTLAGTFVAAFAGLYLFRRVASFPGVRAFSFVMPPFVMAYGIVLTVFFFGRFDYSRLSYGLSFAFALGAFFTVCVLSRGGMLRLHMIPGGEVRLIERISNVESVILTRPMIPAGSPPTLVADLRADLGEPWQRLIAQAALAGIPVYHAKQVSESLTGRVEIEHLSENSFGSLLPNLNYRRTKRLIDLAGVALAAPLLIGPMLLVALAIRLDSPGPVFFRQMRMGHRGVPYHVLKFRTMRDTASSDIGQAARQAAITRDRDPRITRAGAYLRRTRIDELPQLWNILVGQMSWIGPRPEAMELSRWYEAELPFYSYRHIIRPGITGWAQVNQGHVAELSEVHEKLHYDFYYIKNFSGWLDWLIAFRTVGIVLSGFGAK